MKLFRRDFRIVSRLLVCALLLAPLQSADAFWHGSSIVVTNNSRVTLNVMSPAFANLSKGMGFTVLPTNCASPPCADANGYPNQKPTASIVTNPSMPTGYYGTITWSWSGTGSMQDATGNPAIFTSISPTGAVFEMGAVSSGDHAPATYCYCSQSLTAGVSNPTIVFQYGWNIQSIDSNAGVIRINTKTNYVLSHCWGLSGTDQFGNTGPLVNISGANVNTGANGTWVMTNCTASSFDLRSSTFTNAQAGIAGTAIFAGGNLSYNINSLSNNWISFSNLVIAKTPDVQPGGQLANGHYFDATYVAQLQQLMNPNGNCVANKSCGWLRFMDYSAVQSNYEHDFAQRIPITGITYAVSGAPAPWYPGGYYVGAITNTADAYTASDPSVSVWSGSAYIDQAIVQGIPSATNATVAPTLNVGGHGAKPILQYSVGAPPIWAIQTGLPGSPGTDVMQFTFQATWLNSNTPVVVNYPTVASDTTACNLSAHINTFFSSQSTLTSAGIQFLNPNCATGTEILPPTAQAGRLSVTYTSGPAIISMGTITTSAIGTTLRTFQYNYLLDAWLYINAVNGNEFAFSAPIEAAVDLANQVGANVWWNFGTNSVGFIQGVTQTFGNPSTGLTSGLRFGLEAFNETWNSFAFPYSLIQTFGAAFGLSNSGFLANASYTGLRTKQYADISKASWTGQGRSASDFNVFSEWQTQQGVGGVFDVSFLKGTSIGTSNTWIASYGAVGGGTVATNYAASPNRPVDITTFIGQAPYWGSSWWSCGANAQCGQNGIVGTVVQNAPWLQAAKDFGLGSTATAFTEITNTFNGTTLRGASGTGSFVLGTQPGASGGGYHTFWVLQEAIAAQYDASRPGGMSKLGIGLYEGAPQWSFSNNYVAGTNSTSDSTSLTTLTTQITNLGWDVSPYTISGTNTASEMAQMTLNLAQAWKNDATYKNLIKTFYYQDVQNVSGANREVHAAQFGYTGGSTWGLFPSDYHAGNSYQNYNAIQEWNAGN